MAKGSTRAAGPLICSIDEKGSLVDFIDDKLRTTNAEPMGQEGRGWHQPVVHASYTLLGNGQCFAETINGLFQWRTFKLSKTQK